MRVVWWLFNWQEKYQENLTTGFRGNEEHRQRRKMSWYTNMDFCQGYNCHLYCMKLHWRQQLRSLKEPPTDNFGTVQQDCQVAATININSRKNENIVETVEVGLERQGIRTSKRCYWKTLSSQGKKL